MIKNPIRKNEPESILSAIAKVNTLAANLDQMHNKGKIAMHSNGKLPFHTQKELLLGISRMRGSIMDLTRALLEVAEQEHKVGEDIVKLISVVSLNRCFLLGKNMLDEFKAFAERETGTPIKEEGILQKLKFWRRK